MATDLDMLQKERELAPPEEAESEQLLREESEEERVGPPPPIRLAVAVLLPSLSAAMMVGGIFSEITGRIYASIGAILGIALAVVLSRLRRPVVANLLIFAGIFAIGLFMISFTGLSNLFGIQSLVARAITSGEVLRPPVRLTPGWIAILGWLMSMVGFMAMWVAAQIGRPALGVMIPLPIAAVAAISVPKDDQVVTGIAAMLLFAFGLGALSGVQTSDDLPTSYQVRRAVRALPLVIALSVALYFLARAQILFPQPLIDPTQEAQKPKAVPLSQVVDRVLFEVESSISGPWRMGSLDVYDGEDWRLPPFAENKLREIPRDGIVDRNLSPGVKARFVVKGLGGAVLPGLPNTVAVVAEGPALVYDSRNGNIRAQEGQVQAGLAYAVTAANLPSVEQLRALTEPLPKSILPYIEIPDPPPAVVDLMSRAPKDSKWDTFDFLRNYILENVTAKGTGSPVSVTPERVEDMIVGTKEASPFEIVAAEAMMARWAGVPSRIGYGFDGGDLVDGRLQVRPRHGATFVEVYFPQYKWLPVIGSPKLVKTTVGDANERRFDPTVQPSEDIGLQLAVPEVVPPGSAILKQIRLIVGLTALLLALAALIYFTWPALRKSLVRSRRRNAAHAAGPKARIAFAYSELRDYATDLGFHYPADTPFLFVRHFVEDEELYQFSWLVTRALWGDMKDSVDSVLAAVAEELSRSLRRRLGQTQPPAVRMVALFSRTSLKNPYVLRADETLALLPPAFRSAIRSRSGRAGAGLAAAAVWVLLCTLIAGAVSAGASTVRVNKLQSEIAFGARPQSDEVLTGQTIEEFFDEAPVEETSSAFLRFPAFTFEEEPLGECPEATLDAFPEKAAGSNVEEQPPVGAYKWRVSGLEVVDGRASPLLGSEARGIRNVRTSSDAVFDPRSTEPRSAYTFEMLRMLPGGVREVRTFGVNAAALATDPERGLYLERIVRTRANGQVISSDGFAPTTGLLLLPLPVRPGTTWNAAAIDPTSQQEITIDGRVQNRQRVDACGDIIDGWLVESTLTYAGRTNFTRSYKFIVAPQYGGILTQEVISGGSSLGSPMSSQASVGQVKPDPLPVDMQR